VLLLNFFDGFCLGYKVKTAVKVTKYGEQMLTTMKTFETDLEVISCFYGVAGV